MSTPFPATHRPQELEWSWRLSAPFMFVWAFRCRMCSSAFETNHMRGWGYHVVSLWIIHDPPDFIVAMSEHSPSFMEVYGVTPPHFMRFNLAFMRIPLILLTWGRCHVYPVHYPYSTISFWLTNMTIVPCVIYPNRVFAMRLKDLTWHRATWLRTSLCQCSIIPTYCVVMLSTSSYIDSRIIRNLRELVSVRILLSIWYSKNRSRYRVWTPLLCDTARVPLKV